MEIVLLFVLVILVDILAIRDIMVTPLKNTMKALFVLIVLLLPIIGISIYYLSKHRIK